MSMRQDVKSCRFGPRTKTPIDYTIPGGTHENVVRLRSDGVRVAAAGGNGVWWFSDAGVLQAGPLANNGANPGQLVMDSDDNLVGPAPAVGMGVQRVNTRTGASATANVSLVYDGGSANLDFAINSRPRVRNDSYRLTNDALAGINVMYVPTNYNNPANSGGLGRSRGFIMRRIVSNLNNADPNTDLGTGLHIYVLPDVTDWTGGPGANTVILSCEDRNKNFWFLAKGNNDNTYYLAYVPVIGNYNSTVYQHISAFVNTAPATTPQAFMNDGTGRLLFIMGDGSLQQWELMPDNTIQFIRTIPAIANLVLADTTIMIDRFPCGRNSGDRFGFWQIFLSGGHKFAGRFDFDTMRLLESYDLQNYTAQDATQYDGSAFNDIDYNFQTRELLVSLPEIVAFTQNKGRKFQLSKVKRQSAL